MKSPLYVFLEHVIGQTYEIGQKASGCWIRVELVENLWRGCDEVRSDLLGVLKHFISLGFHPFELAVGSVVTCICQVISNSLRPHGLRHTRLPIPHHLLEFAQVHVHCINDAIHLILCHPLLLLPSIFPSIRVFSNESAVYIKWPKYWSFSISISSEYSELVSFRIDWFGLLAVEATLKSLLQCFSWCY